MPEKQVAFVSGGIRVNNHSTLESLVRQGMPEKEAQESIAFRDRMIKPPLSPSPLQEPK